MIEYLSLVNTDDDVWCADHEIDPLLDCVYIRRDRLKNNSLCLSRLICEEEIPFICHSKFIGKIIVRKQSHEN